MQLDSSPEQLSARRLFASTLSDEAKLPVWRFHPELPRLRVGPFLIQWNPEERVGGRGQNVQTGADQKRKRFRACESN